MKKRTQTSDVLAYLKKCPKKGLSPKEAEDTFGTMRLAAIICTLRKRGYDIETKEECVKNRYGTTSTYARYILH